MSMSMNGRKFVEKFTYALESDFTSPSGEPAVWAPGHPKRWGQERANIRLGGKATTPALSPDDRFVAVGVEEEIHVFDVATQERVEVLTGHGEQVETIKFSPALVDNHYILVSEAGVEEAMVILWELNEHGKRVGKREKRVDADTVAAKAMQSLVSELTESHGWNPAETAISTLEQEVKDALRKAITTHEQEDRLTFEGQLGSFGSPAFSPDGKTTIYISQNETTQEEPRDAESLPCVNLWDIETRSTRHQLFGHTDSIMWVAMSPDSTHVASISWGGTARVWDASSGACLHVLGPFGGQLWSGAFSPDGKYLAISQGNPKIHVHVYNIATGQAVSRFDALHGMARSIAWSHDGKMLASGADEGTLAIWDPYTREERLRWCLAFDDFMMRRFATTRAVQFVDGKKLMFQIREGTVEVYDFESNLKRQFTRGAEDKVDKCPIAEMVCSNDSSFLVVPDVDGFLRICDL